MRKTTDLPREIAVRKTGEGRGSVGVLIASVLSTSDRLSGDRVINPCPLGGERTDRQTLRCVARNRVDSLGGNIKGLDDVFATELRLSLLLRKEYVTKLES